MEYLLCKNCGNLITKTTTINDIVCCGIPMELVKANKEDASLEKHVPVISLKDNQVTVKVGEVEHPMEENHYIKWIYLKTNKGIKKEDLKPNMKPIATFIIDDDEEIIEALAFCNLHSLWSKEF